MILKGYMIIPAQYLLAVQDELGNRIELNRQEPGCIVFEVNQDSKNPSRFNVYEEFIDHSAIEYHQYRTKNSKWVRIALNPERYYVIIESGRIE